jgi:hypothetical protein
MLLWPVCDEASQGSTASVRWPSKKGFMQTQFHSQSVTMLVKALQLQWKHRQGGQARRIHANTLPQPVCDKASQGSIASAETQAGWLSEKDFCRHAAMASL